MVHIQDRGGAKYGNIDTFGTGGGINGCFSVMLYLVLPYLKRMIFLHPQWYLTTFSVVTAVSHLMIIMQTMHLNGALQVYASRAKSFCPDGIARSPIDRFVKGPKLVNQHALDSLSIHYGKKLGLISLDELSIFSQIVTSHIGL